MSLFKKAERRHARLKLALTGPSGAGKTYSALALATGLGKKIAVVCTENGSAALYSDKFNFDMIKLEPDYTISKYLDAMKAAVDEKYDVLIVDSLSHAWAGEGGLLQKKEAMDIRGGNSFTNWAKITPEQEKLKGYILRYPLHLICCMRSKQDYVLESNSKGKMAPKKVGLAPVQREGLEYEFTAVLDIAMDHQAQASKDRTELFGDDIFQITADTGKKLLAWLNQGKAVDAPSQSQLKRLYTIATSKGLTHADVHNMIKSQFDIKSSKELTPTHYSLLTNQLENHVPKKKPMSAQEAAENGEPA